MSFVGGYNVVIDKDSPDFCEDCDYFVLLVGEGQANETALVMVDIKTPNTYTAINSYFPAFSSVHSYKRQCYSFNISEYEKSDNLIIQTTLFYGKAQLEINSKDFSDSSSLLWTKMNLDIDNTFKLDPVSLWSKAGGKTYGQVYICIKGLEDTSYLMRVMMENSFAFNQRFNFLFNSIPTKGYLPPRNATRYRVFDFSNSQNVTIFMEKIYGNPQLYGIVCKNFQDCFYDYNQVQQLKKSSK